MKKIAAITIFLLFALSAWGVDPGVVYELGDSTEVKLGTGVKLGLRECLMLGLERNYDIVIESNRQKVSENNATYANAGGLPSVSLSGSYAGSLNNTKYILDGHSGTLNSNGVHNAGINAGVNVNWPIFEGFNIRTTYERLQELREMGELNTRLAIEEFIASFTSQYYNYIRQYIRLKNLRYAVTLSQERLRIVEAHYNIGSKSRLDLQQANVDLNSDKSELMKQYETLHAMRTLLNQMLSTEDLEFPIMAADSTILYDSELRRSDILSSMLSYNTYLEIARKDGDISKLDLKIVESGRYPYLRMNSGYGYTQNWYGSGTYDRQRNLGLTYGVTLGVNLFDGRNQKRREKNARIEVQNVELGYLKTEQAVRKSFSDTWMSYQNNIRLTDLEHKNLEVARELYEIAMERYRLGQLSGIELREAQNSLLAAEERLVQAQLNTKLSEITLLHLSGHSSDYLL